jgi:hypothetical protein
MEVLNQDHIEILDLKHFTFNGIPDEIKGLRPIVWKVLLGVYSENPKDWEKD